MPYNIYFLQIRSDLQAATFAAVDKTIENRFIRNRFKRGKTKRSQTAAVYERFPSTVFLRTRYALGASTGQTPAQAPQSMQASAFTTATPFSTATAPTGQAPSQAPQPTHASETLCAIIKSPFIPVPVVMYEEMCQARLYTSLRNSYPCLHFNKAEKKRQD